MWRLQPTERWRKDQARYQKKRPRELAAVFRNLDRYLKHLRLVPNSRVVQAGYLHPEPGGVLAIDERGGGRLQATRLYTFADDQRKLVHLLAIGDKRSQNSDLEYCRQAVKVLRSRESQKT